MQSPIPCMRSHPRPMLLLFARPNSNQSPAGIPIRPIRPMCPLSPRIQPTIIQTHHRKPTTTAMPRSGDSGDRRINRSPKRPPRPSVSIAPPIRPPCDPLKAGRFGNRHGGNFRDVLPKSPEGGSVTRSTLNYQRLSGCLRRPKPNFPDFRLGQHAGEEAHLNSPERARPRAQQRKNPFKYRPASFTNRFPFPAFSAVAERLSAGTRPRTAGPHQHRNHIKRQH